MTNAELGAIRERCAKATPGPWKWRDRREYLITESSEIPLEHSVICWCEYHQGLKGRLWVIYGTAQGDDTWIPGWGGEAPPDVEHQVSDWRPNQSNANFIAHARTDIPALLAHVDRLQDRIRELEGQQ
jgi:hypothetical protein